MLPKFLLYAFSSIALVFMASACVASGEQAIETAAQTETAEQQLATIMQWWNGDYDNSAQIEKLRTEGKPVWGKDSSGEGGHIEVTSHYRPVTLPAFGDNVIYVEETKYGEPDNIFRQRIYTLTIDEERDVVRVKLWNFNDKKKYIGAWKDLSRLKGVTPKDMFPLKDECDLIVKRQGDKFHMPMPPKSCAFGNRYFNYQVLLGKDSFWFRDRIMSVADDSVLESGGNYTYHELERLR